MHSSRPLLSRSGCISLESTAKMVGNPNVLVPFYRGAVVFDIGASGMMKKDIVLVPFYRGAVVFELLEEYHNSDENVLVPFYRGAVVFRKKSLSYRLVKSSRPLLSRSGCI